MRRGVLRIIAAMMFLAGINIGFIKVLVFLYHQWSWMGVVVGFTFLPPVLICPIWEWIATGGYMTFVFVYLLGLAGIGLDKYWGD